MLSFWLIFTNVVVVAIAVGVVAVLVIIVRSKSLGSNVVPILIAAQCQ